MRIAYNPKYDVLYIKLYEGNRKVNCKEVNEDISVDFDKNNHIVGIEILCASRYLNLKSLLPVRFEKVAVAR